MLKYKDLRDFISQLEKNNDLKRIDAPVSSVLEMTEISDRVLKAEGPALIFQHALHHGKKSDIPVLTNLFGTPTRVAQGMGAADTTALRDIGELLASLREPEAPKGF